MSNTRLLCLNWEIIKFMDKFPNPSRNRPWMSWPLILWIAPCPWWCPCPWCPWPCPPSKWIWTGPKFISILWVRTLPRSEKSSRFEPFSCSVLTMVVVIMASIMAMKVERINNMIMMMPMWVSVVAKGSKIGTCIWVLLELEYKNFS